MSTLNYREVSGFLKVLSHPVRLMIVVELLEGKRCVGAIKELVKVKQPNISQHLSLLKLNGIVDWRQEGKRKCYYLKNRRLIKSIIKTLEKSMLGKPYQV